MKKFIDPPLTIDDQIRLFELRGMEVIDHHGFHDFLTRVSFQRLKVYASQLAISPSTYRFKPDITEKDLSDIYEFDQSLQRLLADILSRVEVCLRTKLINEMSPQYGSHWFLNKDLFYPNREKGKILCQQVNGTMIWEETESLFFDQFTRKLLERCGKDSEEKSIRSYHLDYDVPEFPPVWLCFEELSFGTLSKIYAALNVGEIRKKIAADFGMVDNVFILLLKSMVYVRNLCAHHKFLWKRSLTIKPLIPAKKTNRIFEQSIIVDDRKLFAFMSCLIHCSSNSRCADSAILNLKRFIYDADPGKRNDMGFQEGWMNEPLWQINN
jgi:abortive infection bacteriophage resistance protein